MTALVSDQNSNCLVELDNGVQVAIYANQLHNKELDRWEGWTCWAGMTRLYVDHDGNVWTCEGRNHHLGNISSGWQLLTKPGTCCRNRCGPCTDDLVTEKYEK